jgi:hypothetical protein
MREVGSTVLDGDYPVLIYAVLGGPLSSPGSPACEPHHVFVEFERVGAVLRRVGGSPPTG